MSTGPSENEGPPGKSPHEGKDGARQPSGVSSTLLDTLLVGTVMLDTDGRILLWGPMVERMLGWTAQQVSGRSFSEFVQGGDPVLFRRVLEGRQTWRGILHIHHREGHTVEAEARVSLQHDNAGQPFALANMVETSRIRAVEHDLAALDSVFGSSPLGIAFFDTDLRYVRVNEALARLDGGVAAEYPGKSLHEVLPDWLADELIEVETEVLRTGEPVIDKYFRAPDGRGSRSVSFGRLTDQGGRVLGVSCIVMDTTERREALEKAEAARERLVLLDDIGVALGDLLDLRDIAQALTSVLVPRLADHAAVLLVEPVAHGGELPDAPEAVASQPVEVVGRASRDSGLLVERMFRTSGGPTFLPGRLIAGSLATGTPVLAGQWQEVLEIADRDDPTVQAAQALGVASVVAVPLRARGVVLGLLVLSRSSDRESFRSEDVSLCTEIGDRAGISLDNARLYAREREAAVMLQRDLLPQRVPEPEGVAVSYRYLPGGQGSEVGGDWFDVIPLAGGRVAFVVGDVMGHGLRSAATMGRLRTAVRTLAGLDLPPDELLRRVNDLAEELGGEAEGALMATCVYAVYDPSTRRCVISRAGHVPPLLVTRPPGGGRHAEILDLPAGAPLGVGGVGFEKTELDVAEGSVLALYTDGLIEVREEDIGVGLERLRSLLTVGPEEYRETSLEEVCDELIADLERRTGPHWPDDVALLLAKLGDLPEGSIASWTFPAETYAARRARNVVRRTLEEWELTPIEDTTVLLVSELVTNSLRYAHGPIGVRMVRGTSLLVEVSDPLPDPPRERATSHDDEGGRGMQMVAREARRWGTRHGTLGKTVWFELPLA